MEDSEQRKKRLKEMRMQADQAEVSGGVEGSGIPGYLSNPLIEAPSTMPSHYRPNATPRFDFYTDPMNAFSSNRRSNANFQAAPDNFPPPNFGGSPVPQFESSNHQMTPPPTQASPAAYRNPIWSGPRRPDPYNFPFHPSDGATYPNPRFASSGHPLHNPAQGIILQPNYSPTPSGYRNSPMLPGYRNSPTPPPGYRNSPAPPAYRNSPAPPAYRNSKSHSQGQGRGFWHNSKSPVSGHGSGQGPYFHVRRSSEDRVGDPGRFYKNSMVEDPWKHLKPIVWSPTVVSLYSPENSKPGISKSTSTKREGSSAASGKTYSEPSLAEYLASAFNEAGNDAESV